MYFIIYYLFFSSILSTRILIYILGLLVLSLMSITSVLFSIRKVFFLKKSIWVIIHNYYSLIFIVLISVELWLIFLFLGVLFDAFFTCFCFFLKFSFYYELYPYFVSLIIIVYLFYNKSQVVFLLEILLGVSFPSWVCWFFQNYTST